MASLKEIKIRIGSVKSTRKITAAMKMIASSKLHKAQTAIHSFLPYQKKLDAILTNLLAADLNYSSPFVLPREVKRVGLVLFSSNATLCGAYNATVIKEFKQVYNSYLHLGAENIAVFPVGKKVEDYLLKQQIPVQGTFQDIAASPAFAAVQTLANRLIETFVTGQLDEIVLLFHHFKSVGTQIITRQRFLPFDLTSAQSAGAVASDYIFDPSKEEILQNLIPTVLNARLFASALDATASEHAARTMAMQTATDNADDLIQELTVQFNKTRQQVVTNELLDIIGGASAL
ncbi:MAG: F0F1 ATP synthase subunit gamma [Prevotellaceae bacterium]|jgi:F-type H+-transporting ATPase subunit gamma|nr:F0F1 ATP synthase subunit gamma [Prevotellaceae bacterium]